MEIGKLAIDMPFAKVAAASVQWLSRKAESLPAAGGVSACPTREAVGSDGAASAAAPERLPRDDDRHTISGFIHSIRLPAAAMGPQHRSWIN